MQQTICQEPTVDVLAFSYLSSDTGSGDRIRYGYELNKTAAATTLANRLGVLADRVAGNEVGDDTEAAIVKTTAQSVLPWLRHVVSGGCRLRRSDREREGCCLG